MRKLKIKKALRAAGQLLIKVKLNIYPYFHRGHAGSVFAFVNHCLFDVAIPTLSKCVVGVFPKVQTYKAEKFFHLMNSIFKNKKNINQGENNNAENDNANEFMQSFSHGVKINISN